MTRSKNRSLLALSLLCVTAAVIGSSAACSPGKRAGSASPTPTTLSHCQIVWASTGQTQGHYDLFVVDMPIADWTTGTKQYDRSVAGEEHEALFYDEYDPSVSPTPGYLSRAITTNGDFNVTVPTDTSPAASVSFVDSSGQLFWALDGSDNIGVQLGSGGTGNFVGVWSDPADGVDPTPGAGTINITYNGTPVAVNGSPNAYISYATCYDAGAAFAPLSAPERIQTELEQTFPLRTGQP